MNRDDFVKLVGVASDKEQCVPVAFLLCNGYACAGYYHAAANEGLIDTCVLLNARLIELQRGHGGGNEPNIRNFNEFLEEIVVDFCKTTPRDELLPRGDTYGKSIPLTAIPFEQIAVVYPVAHIGTLMRRAEPQHSRLPTFLDFDKSEFLGLLRTRLW